MASVRQISPGLRDLRVPAPLRDLEGWLCWRYESYEGEAKPRKVPMYASGRRRSGQQGSPADRGNLTTFAAAREAAIRNGYEGVGFALLPEFGITALDFDNCVGPDGELPPEIEAISNTTYTEFSPSGNGIRAFLQGDLGDRKSPTGETYGLETFTHKGFVTVTGNALPHIDLIGHEDVIAPVSDSVRELCAGRFRADGPVTDPDDFTIGYEPPLRLTAGEIQSALDALDAGMGRDEWLRVGMALHHQFSGDDEGFDLWHEWSEDAHNYSGEESMRYQWERFHDDGSGRRRVTMASVLKMAKDAQPLADLAQVADQVDKMLSVVPVIHSGVCTPEGFDGKFPVLSAEAIASQPEPEWLIRGVLPNADLAVIFGASGSGKSFVALQMAACIARGEPWRGHRVKQGKVVIVAAEGGGGYGKRVRAYCMQQQIGLAALPLGVINGTPNLMEAGDITQLATSLRAIGDVSTIFMDTFAQVTPGANENSGEDIGRALANARVLRQVTGAMVILVHHSGKDLARGARGWSGLRAAADAEIEITRDEVSGYREIHLSKLKDGEDGLRWGFRLDVVALGTTFEGDSITSCIVTETEARTPSAPGDKAKSRRRGRFQNHVLEVIATLPSDVQSMPMPRLVQLAVDALPPVDEGKRSTYPQQVTRAIRTLAQERDDPPVILSGQIVIFCTE